MVSAGLHRTSDSSQPPSPRARTESRRGLERRPPVVPYSRGLLVAFGSRRKGLLDLAEPRAIRFHHARDCLVGAADRRGRPPVSPLRTSTFWVRTLPTH